MTNPQQPEQDGRYGQDSRPNETAMPGAASQPTTPPVTLAGPSRRPNRTPLVLGAGALGLAALLTGGMALTSSRTQNTAEELARSLTVGAQSSGIARVESSTYERGLTNSTQVMKIALDDTVAEKPVRLIVTNHIQHGPLPGFQAVGQALVDTEIRFEDPAVQAQVDKAFGGRKPQIRTLVGLDGASHTTVDVPQGQISEDGATISWQPLKGRVDVQGLRSSADLSWPGLNIQGPEVQGKVGPLTLKSDMTRSGADDQLGTGQSQLNLSDLTFTAEGQTMTLKNLGVRTDTKLSGSDFYDTQVGYTVGEVRVPNTGFGTLQNVQLQLSARHLARAPLNRLFKTYNEAVAAAGKAGAKPSETGLPTFTTAQQTQLENDLLALVKGSPQIGLDRLSLRMPAGDVVLKANVGLPGAATMSTGDLQALLETPELAVGSMAVDASLNAPRSALEQLLGVFGGGPLGSLDDLISAGMLKQNGEQVSAELKFGNGEMLLNGQNLGQF